MGSMTPTKPEIPSSVAGLAGMMMGVAMGKLLGNPGLAGAVSMMIGILLGGGIMWTAGWLWRRYVAVLSALVMRGSCIAAMQEDKPPTNGQ